MANVEIRNLQESIQRERDAATIAADALGTVRGAIERMDAPDHRTRLAELKGAFDRLTACSSERSLIAARLAQSLGLRRDATVEAIIEVLGAGCGELECYASDLRKELDRVRANISVLALLTRYGAAMTASLIAIRGQGVSAVPYGRNGHRTANYTRVGRLA